jgi:diguanylate cyclase (GGDEF)-like protein
VDTVARYGGEEFVIILPETTEQEGVAVAERIRNAVAERSFLCGPEMAGIAPLALTISIGISNFPADSHDKKELMGFADAALYAAKAQGRNRVNTHAQSGSTLRPPEV